MRSWFRRKSWIGRIGGVLALASAAALAAPGAHAGPLKGAPAPFDKGGVRIALVNYLSTGDFFQAYEAGAQKQAKALGIDLRIYEGRQDAAEQREQIQQAISLGVAAIIINHGLPESLKDVVQRALDKGIKVVAFDVDLGHPKVPQIEQSDRDLAALLLDQAVKDNGDAFAAGYVYVAGFAPLDRRDAVWRDFKRAHPKVVEKARWGTVDNPIAQSVANQAAAAYRAHPDIRVVFAPYDEFARGGRGEAVVEGAHLQRGHLDRRHRRDPRAEQRVGGDGGDESRGRRRGFRAGRRVAGGRAGPRAPDRGQAGAGHARRSREARHPHDCRTRREIPGVPRERRGDGGVDPGCGLSVLGRGSAGRCARAAARTD